MRVKPVDGREFRRNVTWSNVNYWTYSKRGRHRLFVDLLLY